MDIYIYFSYSYIHTHRKRYEIYNNNKRKMLVKSLDMVASLDPEGPLLYFHDLMNR